MRPKPVASCFLSISILLLLLVSWVSALEFPSEDLPQEPQDSSLFQDVGVGSTVTVRPLSAQEFVESSPGVKPGDLVACTRIRIPGQSRVKNTAKFAHTARVKINTTTTHSFKFNNPKVEICFHRNESLGLGQCPRDSWRVLEKGLWTGVMSPFETRYVDIRTLGSHSDVPLCISVQEEQRAYRLVFMALGMTLLLIAPIVSGWVPFYYSSAMTLGIFLVVLILLYQGMKLLPTGRKSTMYIVLYGSLVGLGTVVVHYFSGLLSTVLLELGFGEDMFHPVALFISVGIGLLGAWLGYWGVRKLVLSEDGGVDTGTAKFVKWAIRVVGGVMLLQTSHDGLFAILALVLGSAIAWVAGTLHFENIEFGEFFSHVWSAYVVDPGQWVVGNMKKPFSRSAAQRTIVHSPRRGKRPYMDQAGLDAIQNIPGKEALVMWEQVSALSKKRGLDIQYSAAVPDHSEMLMEHCEVNPEFELTVNLDSLKSDDWDGGGKYADSSLSLYDNLNVNMACCSSVPRWRAQKSGFASSLLREDFYSTFHKTPHRRPLSKDEYKGTDITEKAVDELVKSDKFQEWWAATVVANNRVSIAPNEHRQERSEDEIEHTAYMAQDDYCSGKYAEYRKGYSSGAKY